MQEGRQLAKHCSVGQVSQGLGWCRFPGDAMERRKDSRPGLLPHTARRKKQAVTRKASGGMSTMHPGKHFGLDGPVLQE